MLKGDTMASAQGVSAAVTDGKPNQRLLRLVGRPFIDTGKTYACISDDRRDELAEAVQHRLSHYMGLRYTFGVSLVYAAVFVVSFVPGSGLFTDATGLGSLPDWTVSAVLYALVFLGWIWAQAYYSWCRLDVYLPDSRLVAQLVRTINAINEGSEQWDQPAFRRRVLRRIERTARFIERRYIRFYGTREPQSRAWLKVRFWLAAQRLRRLKPWIIAPDTSTRGDLLAELAAFTLDVSEARWPRLLEGCDEPSAALFDRSLVRMVWKGASIAGLAGLAVGIFWLLQGNHLDGTREFLKPPLGLIGAAAVGSIFSILSGTELKMADLKTARDLTDPQASSNKPG